MTAVVASNIRIMVVEDDQQFRFFLEELLTGAGYSVVLACNGEEAVDLYDDSIRIVLTDLVMPERDGVSLIQYLRRTNPEVRIIAMSGRNRTALDIDSLRLVRVLGADVTLEKPFSLIALEQSIAMLVSGQDISRRH